ncbi:MAG: hypothetical protein LBG42_03555 [Treponema sp.]|jgi:hypothetical protein|nr:hypothetical protein [Treponema sp.]
MARTPTGAAQYLVRFGEQSIACSQYALTKLGVDRSHCFLKINEYVILCVPFQLGFKRALFLASLSKQELTFFQRYVNGIVGLSIAFTPGGQQEPIKFFIRCNLSTIGQMKGRENVGLFVVDYKAAPDDLVSMLGGFLENQDRIRTLYDDYGKTMIRLTPEISKIIGYNMYATITEPNREGKRIQVYSLSSKSIEHLEAPGAEVRAPGTSVTYQLFFKKYRISAAGSVIQAEILPQGLVRTTAQVAFSPELVEIIDDYWYTARTNSVQQTADGGVS